MDHDNIHFLAARIVYDWLTSSTYRTICHRHNGVFVAGDESERKMMESDSLWGLARKLKDWPNGADEMPETEWVKVQSQ